MGTEEQVCTDRNDVLPADEDERATNFIDSSESVTNDSEDPRPMYQRLCSGVCNFLLRNFLPVCLISGLIIGALFPPPGVFMSQLPTSYFVVVIIFLFNGLKLKTEDLKSALKQYKALLCALICILALSPIIGAKLTELLPYGRVSTEKLDPLNSNATQKFISAILGPGEIKIGFQIYFLMPCTIVTCIVMVTQLGGDVILTMLISVTTNILSIFLIPIMLKWLTSFEADVRLDVKQILLKLVLTVLVPIVVGKLLRFIGAIQRKVDAYKRVMSLTNVALLSLIPWMKVSQTSASNALRLISVPGIFICIGWSSFIHILFLLLAVLLAFLFRLQRPSIKSVLITGSQKTLVLAVTVVSFLPIKAGDQGLMTVPIIVSHLSVVVIDSLLIARIVACEKKTSEEDISLHPDPEDIRSEENINCRTFSEANANCETYETSV